MKSSRLPEGTLKGIEERRAPREKPKRPPPVALLPLSESLRLVPGDVLDRLPHT